MEECDIDRHDFEYMMSDFDSPYDIKDDEVYEESFCGNFGKGCGCCKYCKNK